MVNFIEYEKNSIRSDALDRLLDSFRQYHIEHIRYSCLHSFRYESKLSKIYACEHIAPDTLMKMKFLFSGQHSVKRCIFNYLRTHSHFDLDFFKVPAEQIRMYVPDPRNEKLKAMTRDFESVGVSSIAYFNVEHEGVLGEYTLFSTLPAAESEATLCNRGLESFLVAAHHRLYSEYRAALNPWENLNLLGGHSRDILTLLARGRKLEAIADHLKMTRRGVDYHLANLKQLFEADSNCHLVAKALILGAIEGHHVMTSD